MTSLEILWSQYHQLEREMDRYRSRTDDEGTNKFDQLRDEWIVLGERLRALEGAR